MLHGKVELPRARENAMRVPSSRDGHPSPYFFIFSAFLEFVFFAKRRESQSSATHAKCFFFLTHQQLRLRNVRQTNVMHISSSEATSRACSSIGTSCAVQWHMGGGEKERSIGMCVMAKGTAGSGLDARYRVSSLVRWMISRGMEAIWLTPA